MWRSLGRVNVDRRRSIERVQRRVSSLAGGPNDRAALAKSILASHSLLGRNDDIGRLLELLGLPSDERYRDVENRDRTGTGTAIISGTDYTPSVGGLQRDRFGSSCRMPPQQTLSTSVVESWTDHIDDRRVSAGPPPTQRQEQIPLDRSRSASRPSTLPTAEDRPENVNASATPTDTTPHGENPQTSGYMAGNPSGKPAAESQENGLLSESLREELTRGVSAEGVSMGPAETDIREREERDVATEPAEMSVDSGKVTSSSLASKANAPAARVVTFHDGAASNALARVTKHVDPAANSTLPRPATQPTQGKWSTS